jgi:hypothetical protein
MTSYAHSIGHRIHSLSVEDIRYFFDDQFPIKNTIPTVNFDLTDDTPVLLFAPSRPSAFKFPAGAIVDYVLSNNDETDKFGESGATNLEQIVHYMHMLEMWHMASQAYKDIKSKNVNVQEVCPCLVDEHENEIIDYLTTIYEMFKDWIPAPIDGERKWPTYRNRKGRELIIPFNVKSPSYKAAYDKRDGRKIEGELFRTIDGEEYQIVPELKDSKSWNSYWKSKVVDTEITEEQQDSYNFAMYMFCKIKYLTEGLN